MKNQAISLPGSRARACAERFKSRRQVWERLLELSPKALAALEDLLDTGDSREQLGAAQAVFAALKAIAIEGNVPVPEELPFAEQVEQCRAALRDPNPVLLKALELERAPRLAQ